MKIDKGKFIKIAGNENVVTEELELRCYSRDMSVHQGIPDMVIFPRNTEQVSEILQAANKHGIPVTPRGAATSVTGAVIPRFGGIVLDMCKMKQIKETVKEDGYIIAEPGVICGDLNRSLADTGLFFPPEPGSSEICTIGGMVATNASGIRAVKYGTTKDYVMALQAVMADGKKIRTGTTAPKTSAGYDLTRLLVGSEGTLGVVTEVTLRLLPVPDYVSFGRVAFRGIEDAGDAVAEVFARNIPISACEILDSASILAVNKVMGLQIPEEVGCLLFIEIDGHPASVKDYVNSVKEVCLKHNSLEATWSDVPEERVSAWQIRGGLVPSLSKLTRGERLVPLVEDFGVPISVIPQAIKGIEEIGKKHGFSIPCFGHVGDGNLHAVIVMDVRKQEEWDKAKIISEELLSLTFKLNGTVSAEHGIGMAKASYVRRALGSSMDVMRELKSALDPKNILNPGKMGLDDSIKDMYDHFAFSGATQELRSLGEAVDNEILACTQCGACRIGCPIFEQTHLSSRNARGHLILAYDTLTGAVKPSRELADTFYQCTTCLNCRAVCPGGVEVVDIVKAVRERLTSEGYLPEIHKKLLANIRKCGNPFGEPEERRIDVYPAERRASLGGGQTTCLSEESADSMLPADRSSVLLFFGCVTTYQDLRIVPGMMRILESAGVKYDLLGNEEHCCGYLAHLVGSPREFQECVEENVATFSRIGPKSLVTTCAGCYETFKELYPTLDFEVLHAVEFVEKLISEGKLQFPTPGSPRKVIYHDPCDLGRHMGVYEPPRMILNSIPGIELFEFKMNRKLSRCCGGGGGMKACDEELSGELAYNRILQAAEAGADVLVSACPSCKNSFQNAAGRLRKEKGVRLRIMDIIEIVAGALQKRDE